MRCPECKIELVIDLTKRRYETLIAHVSDPNGESPLRECYVCPNQDCCLFENVFWDLDGDFYDITGKGSSWAYDNRINQSNLDLKNRKGTTALDSLYREIDENIIKANRGWRKWRRKFKRLYNSFKRRCRTFLLQKG